MPARLRSAAKTDYFSLLPDELFHIVATRACFENVLGNGDGSSHRSPHLRLVNKRFAGVLPVGEYRGLFQDDPALFAASMMEYVRDLLRHNDKYGGAKMSTDYLYTRFFTFATKSLRFPGAKRAMYNALVEQWPALSEPLPLEAKARIARFLCRFFGYLDREDLRIGIGAPLQGLPTLRSRLVADSE